MDTFPSLYVSFVHGYQDLSINLAETHRPALWHLNGTEQQVFSYPFPRNVDDFSVYSKLIVGEQPYASAKNFKKLPRFGLTGLARYGSKIYAGSWNAVYEIDGETGALLRIVSNHLMSDLHGIWADEKGLITVLTGKDLIVMTDYEGRVTERFAIGRDLSIYVPDGIDEVDWRFVSKQFRGSTGHWHFNYVQRYGNKLWLTARNANCFVVVDLDARTASFRLMNLCTPALLHDGILSNGKHYFTSIDGKVIIAEQADGSSLNSRERVDDISLYHRDMVTKVIRLEETDFGRMPNWCRGIEVVDDDRIFVTVDGRYDTQLRFGLVALTPEGKILNERWLDWSAVGDDRDLRFVTGFDVIASKDK